MKKIIIIGIVLIAVFILKSAVIPSFGTYSEGERSGVLQKFSNKGFMIKTWEGELAMEGIKTSMLGTDPSSPAGNVSSVFSFSVDDAEIANQITTAVGLKVKLYYRENLHTNIFSGSTDYFITKVEILK